MSHCHLTGFIFAALTPCAFIACADQSPVAPGAPSDGDQGVPVLALAVTGIYTLTVYATTVGRGAVLDTYVTDASGHPATSGTVTFKYCSLQGVPAPRSACNTGSGKWMFWGSAGIIPTGPNKGHALMGYTEAPPAGTTIGFRSRYNSHGSSIASHLSNSANYTWPQ